MRFIGCARILCVGLDTVAQCAAPVLPFSQVQENIRTYQYYNQYYQTLVNVDHLGARHSA